MPEQRAVTLFADPKGRMDSHLYSRLSTIGFRRSGDFVYRPHCGTCNACVSVRLPIDEFTPSRQQKRVWKMNADIEVIKRPAEFCDEHYQLYERYITQRNFDGDMYPPSEEQYKSFLISDWLDIFFYEFRVNGKLLAVAVGDVLDCGLSAVYTFFDPDEEKRSLGTYAILWQIEESKRLALPHLYLGYWIRNCNKMSYKIKFRPIELLINNEWLKAR
jgi:arginine-tRNA-protein transferase